MISILYAALFAILSAAIVFIICLVIPKEKIKTINRETEQQEQQLKLEIAQLKEQYLEKEKELISEQTNLINENNFLHSQQQQIKNSILVDRNNWEIEKAQSQAEFLNQSKALEIEIKQLEERKSNIISLLEKEAYESGQIFKNQQIQLAQEQVDKAKNDMQENYSQAANEAKESYLEVLSDLVNAMEEQINITEELAEEKKAALAAVVKKLEEAQSKANAAIEVNKRAELERQQRDFYRLQLSAIDIEEIKRLRSVEPYLRNKEPLNKVIYKCYYEKPYTDLIGRVFGARKPMGIYKITNLQNGKCYVGQAVNIGR